MESTRAQMEAQLQASDRAEVAAWLSWEPPLWHGAFFAVWTFAFVANAGISEAGSTGASQVYLALTLLAPALLWWQRRQVGTYPTGHQPPELSRPLVGSIAAFIGVLLAAWVLAGVLPWWVAALGGAAGTYAAMAVYRLTYRRAADRVRSRLGIRAEAVR